MNRISAAIARVTPLLKDLAPDKLAAANKSANIDYDEYVAFQNTKSLAQASGTLSYDEAVSVYGILGSGPEHFNKQPLAEKLVVTKILTDMLGARLNARLASV